MTHPRGSARWSSPKGPRRTPWSPSIDHVDLTSLSNKHTASRLSASVSFAPDPYSSPFFLLRLPEPHHVLPRMNCFTDTVERQWLRPETALGGSLVCVSFFTFSCGLLSDPLTYCPYPLKSIHGHFLSRLGSSEKRVFSDGEVFSENTGRKGRRCDYVRLV